MTVAYVITEAFAREQNVKPSSLRAVATWNDAASRISRGSAARHKAQARALRQLAALMGEQAR